MIKNNNSKKGFTLIEVLISMLVISVVLALTLPAISKQKSSVTGEKWDYGLMSYNITYSPASAAPGQQDVSIGTMKRGGDKLSRLTVQGARWTDENNRSADMILQSTVSPWVVMGFTSVGIPVNATDRDVNLFSNMSKLMFDDRNNIGMGPEVFSNLSIAKNNIAIGRASMKDYVGGNENNDRSNIAIGSNTMAKLRGGNENIALGNFALSTVTTGNSNVAIGYGAGAGLENGNFNQFIGSGAGKALSRGEGNIFIGVNAGGAIIKRNNWRTVIDPTIPLTPCLNPEADPSCILAQGITEGNYNIFIGPNASTSLIDGESGMILISNGPTFPPFQTSKGEDPVSANFKMPLLFIYRSEKFSEASGGNSHFLMWSRNLHLNNVIAKGKINYSDRRLKNIIGEYQRGLKEVLKIEPVTYYLKDKNASSRQQVGVVAQDLVKIIPEAVQKQENGYYTVSYKHIDMAVVNAVKELSIEEDNLDARITRLENKLKEQNK